MQQEFEHHLETRDIVIRQDDGASTFIERAAGYQIPLLRIKDTVVSFANVISVELSVGTSFLPFVTISIDDSRFDFRQDDWIHELDIITLYIGNPQDETYKSIKNDYRITNVSSAPGSAIVSFTAVLYVPELYTNRQQHINGTSLDAMKHIAKECALGFVHNVQGLTDSMEWLWGGRQIDWIQEQIIPHAYSDNTTTYIAYVDQFANLNFIDVKRALDSGANTTLESDPLSGKTHDAPVQLKLTNNRLDRDTDILITYYTPDNNYGELAVSRYNKLTLDRLSYDHQTAQESTVLDGILQVNDSQTIHSAQTINSHINYDLAASVNEHNKHLVQGQYITAKLDYYISVLYMNMSVPIDIFNAASRTYKNTQNTTDTQSDVANTEPKTVPASHSINDNLTGEYMIRDMRIVFVRDAQGQNSETDHRLTHVITAFKKKHVQKETP